MRPGRLIWLALIGLAVWAGFFAVPGGNRAPDAFDPAKVALAETELWQAAAVKEDVGIYTSSMFLLREQHRYTWFRAVQAGFYLGRATIVFNNSLGKFERVLPDLEAAARIQRDWTGASFDPVIVARAQLDWWVALRTPGLTDQVTGFMANEYALRYDHSQGPLADAAIRRAQAAQMRELAKIDPDWPAITALLTDSYRSLAEALRTRRTSRLAE